MNPQMMMMMLPMVMQMIQGMGKGGMGDFGGKDAEYGSTYGKGALSTLDDIQRQVKNMGNRGTGDITQNQNYNQGQNWLNSLFNDPQFFNQFEAPLMRNYEENTIPDLANRFAGMGSGGALGSTGFRNQATREAGNLHSNIAALRGGLQQQGVNQGLQYAQQPANNYLQMLQQALTPTQNQYKPPTAGFFGDILSSMSGGLSQGFGNMLGQGMAPGGGGPGSGSSSASLPTNVSLPSAASVAQLPFMFGA